MVELLIEKGANINMVSEDGPTLLHYAAAFSDKREVVELLIKEGANMLMRWMIMAILLYFLLL